MAQEHVSESELVRDFNSVLRRVSDGVEVIVEQDHRPVARITAVHSPGRPIDECIAIAEARASNVTLDDQFGDDLEEIIAQRKPLDTSSWD